MMGAYSDNQPDYSWYYPYTAKEANMYLYPVKKFDNIKNANKDFASVKKHYDLRKNKANALLCIAFGNLGLGNKGIAAENFKRASTLDPYNLDAKIYCNK